MNEPNAPVRIVAEVFASQKPEVRRCENGADRHDPTGMGETRTLVKVVADDRENAGGVIDELRRRVDEVSLEVRRLEVGDFLVEGNFAVERKTLRDLSASVIDARLFKQAAQLAAGARRGVLILE